MAFTPSKSALRFSRSQGGGGGGIGPPHQLTSSRKPTSNRVNQGRNGKGVVPPPPLVPWKDAKWPVPARVNA